MPSEDLIVNLSDLSDRFIASLQEYVVLLVNPEGHYLSWNPGVEQTFGYRPEEFIGQSIDLVLALPDQLRGAGNRELERAAKEGRASETRWLVTKSGRHILVECTTVALRNDSGELLGFGKILRDVTERKNAEEALTAVTRALDQSTVIVRQWDGIIDYWTAGCERLYGWSSREAVGQVAKDLLHTNYPEPLEQIRRQLLERGIWNGEVEHLRRDGRRVCVSTSWVLLNDANDEPLSVIETHTDITARLQMRQELESANARLQSLTLELSRSNEELEEFARIASHDLSAPITTTRWLVNLLESRHSEQLDGSGLQMITQIGQGLERMSDLVDAVLQHARVGTSTVASAEPIPAAEALAVAVDNLQHDFEVSSGVIEAADLPEVFVDFQPLCQLFQNLLSNAIKYRDLDKAPVVHVSACWRAGAWEFAVQDNGIGIDEDWHERVFLPMQRRHGMEISGSGIGLATCKKIVSRVGGKIWVQSQRGAGSTFRFTLPGPEPIVSPES